MGVSALASGTFTSALHSYPDAVVFMLDYSREPGSYQIFVGGKPRQIELFNIRFSKKFYLKNNVARLLASAMAARILPESWRIKLLSKNPYLKRILGADIVLAIGGGDSFSDIYGMGRLLYVALPQLLVLQLKKPLALLPQTLGPFKGCVAKAIARYIMRNAAAVFSRDRTSFDEAGLLLGDKREKLVFSYDMAFAMEAIRPRVEILERLPQRSGRPVVGLNVSGLLMMGGYSQDNMFGLKCNYPELINRVVEYFVQEQNADVLLVAHVFGTDAESDTTGCWQVHEQFKNRFPGRVNLCEGEFNQHEIKHVIGECDFFLGARMHACIAAISQSVPAVCMAYSRKFIGVMESIGCPELVADLCAATNDEAMARIADVYARRDNIRKRLDSRIPEVRSDVLALFSPQRLGVFQGGKP
jgi:polysaccharide pyruvyl transferase WcaK-like protein